MNIVNFSTEVRTMTSREIAELTGKRHDNVMADTRKMLSELGLSSPDFSGEYKDSTGRTLPCFNLPHRETTILVSGYSIPMRARVVDRWKELESQQGPQIPQTYAAALLEAGRLALEVEQKNHLLAVQAPKVAFADRVAGDDKGVNIGNYARAVGIGQNVLFRALRDHRILMSGGNRHNLPLQDYIERGYFTVKEGTRTHNDETVPTFTPMVTGKGQQWLTRRLIDLGYLKPIAA